MSEEPLVHVGAIEQPFLDRLCATPIEEALRHMEVCVVIFIVI